MYECMIPKMNENKLATKEYKINEQTSERRRTNYQKKEKNIDIFNFCGNELNWPVENPRRKIISNTCRLL